MKKEIWKPVPGREKSHIVSNCGNVRSIDRIINYENGKVIFKRGAAMSLSKDGSGYPIINLSWSNKIKYYTIHRLVWDVFGKKDRNGYDVDHEDEDKENNHISNLQLLTHRDNTVKRLSNTEKSKSKIVGVHKKSGGKEKPWRTSIMTGGKRTHLGYFATVIEAKTEYERAKKEYEETGTVTKIFIGIKGIKTKIT